MPNLSENQVQRQILDFLEAKGMMPCLVGQKRKTRKSKYIRVGIPDILAFFKGRALFIEVKKKGGVTSDAQLDFIERLKFLGAYAFVADCLDDVLEFFDEHR